MARFRLLRLLRRHGDDARGLEGAHRRGPDAIFFGAVGWPDTVPDHVSLWGSLLQFRREYDQYVNLRPVRLMAGVPCPLAGREPGSIDFWVVRENTEGEYSSVGGRHVPRHRPRARHPGDRHDPPRRRPDPGLRLRAGAVAAEEAPDLGHQVERHRHHHALLGRAGGGHGEAVSRRAHGQVPHRHPDRAVRDESPTGSTWWWDRTCSATSCPTSARPAPGPSASRRRAASTPSALRRRCSSRSTAPPDIAGKGLANPVGQIWSAAMMLDHLGERDAAAAILAAIEAVLAEPALRTADLKAAPTRSPAARPSPRRCATCRSPGGFCRGVANKEFSHRSTGQAQTFARRIRGYHGYRHGWKHHAHHAPELLDRT